MREIEVKARLQNKDSFLKTASGMGISFGEPITQDDVTYESTLPKDDPRWNIFRIRKQEGKIILTMKYKASVRPRDNHERETIIGDADQVADMLERLGYFRGVHIRKSRQIAKYSGLELCIDEVDKLGAFVEVEKLTDEKADVDKIQSELWALLLKLGIDSNNQVHKGYDTLMHELTNAEK